MKITPVGLSTKRGRSTVKKISLSDSVATEVRVALARRDVTQQDLAESLGVTPIWVSRRLRGHVAMTIDELAAIAQLLGMQTRDLLPEDDGEFGDAVKALQERLAPRTGLEPVTL